MPQRPAWGVRRALPDTIAQDYITMTKLQRRTNRLGSTVERRYVPGDLLRDPPAPKDITLEALMAAQTHLGHNTALWNPANARYIFGVRAGVHVIALEQTALHLRRAARVVEEVSYRGGLLLFVGTRRGQADIVVRAAARARACHLFGRWTPGTITNRDQILRHAPLRIVDELDRDLSEPATSHGREGGPFEDHLMDRRPLVPDLVVVLNPMENFPLLRECAAANVPTVGLIDTDADPGRVTYPIPGNDDSLRSVALIAGVLSRAGEIGQKRRLRDAEAGIVTWETPVEVAHYMDQRSRRSSGAAAESRTRTRPHILAGGKIL